MGSPEFAVPTLRKIVSSGRQVVAVYTRAPKPGGRRGLEIRKTPVHEVAESLQIPVHTPPTLKTEEAQELFRGLGADVVLVIAYGLLLPPAILAAPRFGCLNLHASLLPRWRGAAPIQRAIMAGDRETGVDSDADGGGIGHGPSRLARSRSHSSRGYVGRPDESPGADRRRPCGSRPGHAGIGRPCFRRAVERRRLLRAQDRQERDGNRLDARCRNLSAIIFMGFRRRPAHFQFWPSETRKSVSGSCVSKRRPQAALPERFWTT